MTKGEIDLKLDLFVRAVRAGKTPSPALLEFIADGVEAFRKDAKPWQVKTGRKAKGQSTDGHIKNLQAYCLRQCGINNHQIGGLLGDATGEMGDKTIQRAVLAGKAGVAEQGAGAFMYKLAIEELLERDDLTTEQRKAVKEEYKKAVEVYEYDPEEPDY
ncbi:hypothetical protein Q5L94_01955 [Idiomarina sp. Sol25]|uniref:hypothetical protein n=1 Tax=Idiomarina sp. Sol25 TaxID=3064000 RepID=UPI00294B3EB3|nr:hypothetical protein [Idiomarina sp. Sol25]MDV6326807.1 hypothetical protein [Idiomarina sp. Sol25]